VSKFDFRDISDRLSRSRDTEAVVFEFLSYLQQARPDWRATLAFYEVSRDALVSVYDVEDEALRRRDVVLPIDQLPPRLVRKFFHPSAFFNRADRRSLLAHVLQTSPSYEPDPFEAPALRDVAPLPNWQSCVCMPLADQEDVLALLVIASDRKNAFGSKVVGEIIPVKGLASLALAQHLYRNARPESVAQERISHELTAEFQERIRQLSQQSEQLREDNQLKARKLRALGDQIEQLDKNSGAYREELERVKGTLFVLEEQTVKANENLSDAYSQLTFAQSRLDATQRTVEFLKEVFQVLAEEHDRADFPRTMVSWFCEHFGIERCSLMLLDRSQQTLQIAAQRGISPEVASKVRVRIGQGIAGWVAHNRKPLFVRVRGDAGQLKPGGHDAYNSDSFISVPLVHNNQLVGVLNLSNRSDSNPFDDLDFDRAVLAGALLAMMLSSEERARRAASWS
jgi:transcriptional regulator with GAF, ATPase, and Fis domain